MTKERVQKADKLKLVMTAGVGSDHIDLQTAADKGMTVVEVTGVPPDLLRVTFCLTPLPGGASHVLVCVVGIAAHCVPDSLGLLACEWNLELCACCDKHFVVDYNDCKPVLCKSM